MRLNNKVALVTGATSGIGRSIAEAFVREGAITYIIGIEEKEGRELADKLVSEGGRASFLKADVASAADTDRVLSEITREHDKIDILVNNAGMAYKATITELTEEQWDRQIAVNLKSVYLYCHRIIPIMAKHGGGAVINMGSVTSLVGVPDFAAYVSSKSGMLGLTRAMALDHANQGVRVNIICPSGVRTPLMDWQYSQAPDPQAEIKRVVDLHPIGRMADPDEVAELAVYLGSDKGAYFTGTAFPIDGGYTAR